MHYTLAAFSLLGLAAAAPQGINIDAALAVPTPSILGPKVGDVKPAEPTYNPAVAASAVAAIVKSEGTIQKRGQEDDLIVDDLVGKTAKRNACDAQPLG